MISTNEFRNGLTIKLEGQLFQLLEFQHVKPGKGGAFVRTKLRNLITGNVLDRTFRAGEKVEEAFIEQKRLQYLYSSGDEYHFMDQQTFDQYLISAGQLGDAIHYLKENMIVSTSFYQGKLIEVEPPIFVDLKVIEAEPGVRGDTAKGGTKQVRLETGYTIQVPLFIQKDDIIKIDTRTGAYVGRT